MTITIEEFVSREIIYCVSTLVYELAKKDCCLNEDLCFQLFCGSIDYEAAKYELEQNEDKPFKMFCQKDDEYYWGIKNFHGTFKVDPIYNDQESAIAEYYEQYLGDRLEDYRQEIFEHHLVTPYMSKKLIEEGETVVEMFNLYIWCRATTGMSYIYDSCIVSIYEKLISK
jgi:hypothetical protein